MNDYTFLCSQNAGKLEEIYDILVDDRLGVIHSVEEIRTEPGYPDFFHFSAEACNTGAFCGQENFRNTGGASSCRNGAMAKAIGEAVERYCAALYDIDEFPLHSAQDAPFPCANPAKFALYSAEQYNQPGFPWVPFTKDTTTRWTEAYELTRHEPGYLPAALVWIPYRYVQGSNDSPIVQPISTGLACHDSWEQAAVSGIYEVIERDAFTIMWQAHLSMPQIRIETLSDENYGLVRRFESTRRKVFLLDITLDVGVPTVLSILRSEVEPRSSMVFAAAADLSPERAVRAALEELAHTYRYSQQIKSNMSPIEPDPSYEQVQTQAHHLNFAADHANFECIKFTLDSLDRIAFDDMPDSSSGTPKCDLAGLAEKIDAIGYQVFIADLTSPDIRDLGLSVIRAVIPGFHPLFMGHNLRSLGGKRLWEIPGKLGYDNISLETGDNPIPHPYP